MYLVMLIYLYNGLKHVPVVPQTLAGRCAHVRCERKHHRHGPRSVPPGEQQRRPCNSLCPSFWKPIPKPEIEKLVDVYPSEKRMVVREKSWNQDYVY